MKRQWHGVFCHGIIVAAFPDSDNARRWGAGYFAANTPWGVYPLDVSDESMERKMSDKRVYFKLSFGPDYIGWFDVMEDINAAVPRLWKRLADDGVVKFVKHKDANSGREYDILEAKPPHDMLCEAVEMTPEEFAAIPTVYSHWASGPML